MKNAAVYYAIDTHPLYLFFAKESIKSLRRFNKKVKVYLFLYGSTKKATDLTFFRQYHVMVIKRKMVYKADPRFLKWDALRYLKEERLLFLDADTIFFNNVGRLFERFKKYDFYAREEIGTREKRDKIGKTSAPFQLNRRDFSRMVHRLKIPELPIFNTGVMLFNHSIHKRISQKLFREYYRKFIKGKMPYPLRFRWAVLNEIVASLVLGGLPHFTYGTLSKVVTPWYMEVKKGVIRKPGIVMHTWTTWYPDYLKYFKKKSYD